MPKYLDKFAVFTKEGMERVDEIIDREKLETFMKELSPFERYVLADVLHSMCTYDLVIMNSIERCKDALGDN